MRGLMLKIAIVVVSVMLAALVAEGLYSALTGGSLLRLGIGVQGARVTEISDEDRARVGELTPGPFAVDVDPWVVSRMKASTTREIVGVPATTDAWGQRVRPGPEPEDGGQRIVVLGDSVAFGFGVADDHTYAHRLEVLLGDATTSGPKPSVWTVACPGWSGVNAFRYLGGHLARLDPDLVVYVPTRNDLDDAGSITETGHRTLAHSPRSPVGRPLLSRPQFFDRAGWMGARLPKSKQLEIATAGGRWWDVTRYALYSRLGPTSASRWAALTDLARETDARLEARGGRLVVAVRWDNAFLRDLELDLRAGGERPLEVIPMLDEERPEDALEKDSHPNPDCILAGASVLARRLIALGLVERAAVDRVPEPAGDYAGRARGDFTLEELRAWRKEIRARNARFVSDSIDVATGVGFHQVYGGLAEDGWIGAAVSVLLPGGAREITARIELPPASSGVFPLAVVASATGASGADVPLGEPRRVFGAAAAGTPVDVTWAVPRELLAAPFLDVHLNCPDWAVERVKGRMQTRSCRLLSIRARR